MSKAYLFVGGVFYWMILHRYVYLYMGEATFLTLITGILGLAARNAYEDHRDDTPNLYAEWRERWGAWHLVCWLAGGILLEGVSRFL